MRKVLIPIQIKLVSFFIAILTISLSFYVYYAVNLFKNDKSAYVFESVKLQGDSLTKLLKERLGQIEEETLNLRELVTNPISLKKIFDRNSSLVSYVEYSLKLQKITKEVKSNKFKISSSELAEVNFNSKLKVQLLREYLIFNIIDGEKVIVTIYDNRYLLDLIGKSYLYSYQLLTNKGVDILSGDKDTKLSINLLQRRSQLGLKEGTFINKFLDERFITAFGMPIGGVFLFTSVNERKAYEASERLISKSFYYGLFVAALTIFFVMLYSKIFTGPIKKLFDASQLFAQKNFSHKVVLSNNDELGVLADSFNEMSDSIIMYMEEMKEKSRLEGEMKTAKLVQDSFFPSDKIINDIFSLKSFYSPASECGGDWWGKVEIDNKLIVIIIDATGHGTGAALVTAMAHNTLTYIQEMSLVDKSILLKPEMILNFLNKSISNILSDMMATGFVAIIDLDTKQFSYSNASHNPPLIIKSNDSALTKESIVPLIDNLGKRLGEDKEEVFTSSTLNLGHGDKVIFYTDGLTEGENLEKKQWGKRNFLKTLVSKGNKPIADLIDSIVEDSYHFYNEEPQSDDITVVGVELL